MEGEKREVNISYQQGTSECVGSEKVTNMVGTFLADDSNSFKIPVTQATSKKVTNTVGTFLVDDSNSFKIPVTQATSEKVTNMVGTFLNDDNNVF